MNNKFYYEWGNEKPGHVTTWELIGGEIKNSKQEPREIVLKEKLKYNCPYS
ncbi:MAG: hypothetical protein IJ681_00620 [Bacteroidales bacterium]|nr:hypothetical protein [Bacteroidales bacterium]